jgi:hypothetical protein
VSQSDHGIDPHCSPRRKVASQGGDDTQQNRDAYKGPRVCSPHAIKQALQVESDSVLNDFLDYCTRGGLLSPFEREILIRFKVDGFTYKEIQNRHTVLTDQAVRLRVHRIMQRLQEAALTLGTGTDGLNNASRQVTPTSHKKSPTGVKHFSLKHSDDFLPISKSRRQLSLDSSLTSREGQRQQRRP